MSGVDQIRCQTILTCSEDGWLVVSAEGTGITPKLPGAVSDVRVHFSSSSLLSPPKLRDSCQSMLAATVLGAVVVAWLETCQLS